MNEDYKQHTVYIDNIEVRHVWNWKDKLIAWEETRSHNREWERQKYRESNETGMLKQAFSNIKVK